jgi:uncharacterized protein (TIGR02118 family)
MGESPDAPATYVGECHLMCDSVEAYTSAFRPYAQEITGDIHKFTDVTPVVLISEVVVEDSEKL